MDRRFTKELGCSYSRGLQVAPRSLARYSRLRNSWGLRRACIRGIAEATELLVDADTHSLAEIKRAIAHLEEEGRTVRTAIYAAPNRERNKQWRVFMQKTGVNFCPVPRSDGEANDSALMARLAELADESHRRHIALLVQDNGFLAAVQDASSKADLEVFVPSRKFNVLRRYEEAGARVRSLEAVRDSSPKIRAILHTDGTGSVQFADPYISCDNTAQVEHVRGFLQGLAFDDGSYLVHAAAKFWLRNALGPLAVFPQQCATQAVHEITRQRAGERWKKYGKRLAFVIPKTSPGGTSMQVNRYGSVLARRIFRGGGPFIVPDTPDLTGSVLRRLGYLDDSLNSNLAEAMLVFTNMSDNKHCLRKLDMLPSPDETAQEVQEKLRIAFLSHETAGLWQKAPMDGRVRQVLQQHGLLDSADKACKAEVFRAMQTYAGTRLPPSRTYNGYVWQILSQLTLSNPLRTPAVRFKI